MIDLIKEYYAAPPDDAGPGLLFGQLARTVCFFDYSTVSVLHPIGDIEFGEAVQFRVGRPTSESFDHTPLKRPELRSDEALAVVGCKYRPVIVVSQAVDAWDAGRQRSRNCYLVAPLYKAANYGPGFVARVRAYEYNTLFYLPENTARGMLQSFVRFDKLQVVCADLLQTWPNSPTVLTEDAMYCLWAWMCYYQRGVVDALLAEYRREALAGLA